MLIVASGNKFSGISNIVRAQVDSLRKEDLEIDMFAINGKGWLNYFKSVLRLRKILKKNEYCIVHAHYSFSTWVALLSGAKNVVSSLMGSDVKSKTVWRFLIRYLLTPFCKVVIVKSEQMKLDLRFSEALVIPNGVDDEKFFPQDRIEAQKKLNWNPSKVNVLFPSDPSRKEKNYSLLVDAIAKLPNIDFEVHVMKEIPFDELNVYYNASDLVCLTSNREGSPNAIKEAMACDKLVVCTKVGDVPWLFQDGSGLFLASNDAESFAHHISVALEFGKFNGMRSNGREQIEKCQITSRQIAKRLIQIYSVFCSDLYEHRGNHKNSL